MQAIGAVIDLLNASPGRIFARAFEAGGWILDRIKARASYLVFIQAWRAPHSRACRMSTKLEDGHPSAILRKAGLSETL